MLFTTYWFVCFAALFFPLYWACARPVLRRGLLLAGCAVFHYHFAGPAGVLPVVVLGLLTYLAALTRRRLACALAIAVAVAALLAYKYTLFLCQDLLAFFSPELAANAVEDGFDAFFVQQQVGHAWGATTALYTGVSSDYKNRALAAALGPAFTVNAEEG